MSEPGLTTDALSSKYIYIFVSFCVGVSKAKVCTYM